jgi:putative transposase
VVAKYRVSERLACRVLGRHRSAQRKILTMPDDEAALTDDIIALATQCGRYGYRRIAAMLERAGWTVNLKRVERIWRREGLKVPQKQPKKGRLRPNDGSCVRQAIAEKYESRFVAMVKLDSPETSLVMTLCLPALVFPGMQS